MAGKNSGRGRGFNAAKKGSGQVGFQTAPPVHPEVPSAADDYISAFPEENDSDGVDGYLDEMYNKFKNTTPVKPLEYSLEDSDGLSLDEQVAVLEARERLSSAPIELSPDSSRVASQMFRVWGLTDDQYEEAIDKAQEKFEANYDYYDYLNGNEAADSVRNLIEEAPFYGEVDSDTERYLDSISSGKILISKSDLEQLRKIRDEAYTIHARDTSPDRTQPLDAEWISASVQRKCELCGQFISTRDSHGSFSRSTSRGYGQYRMYRSESEMPSNWCKGNYEIVNTMEQNFFKAARTFAPMKTFVEKVKWGSSSKVYNMEKILPLEEEEILVDFNREPYSEDYLNIPEIDRKKLPNYSPELLEDAYMTGDGSIREHIIALHAEKKGLGGKKTTFVIPKNIREAIIEAPPYTGNISSRIPEEETLEPMNKTMLILASRIEPGFSDGEIKRMIMKGDAGVVNALLSSQRTHSVAAEIVSNYPSVGARVLALKEGKISSQVLSSMASSGSPEIRTIAASSPSLSHDDALRLAEDPDSGVRKALIVPQNDSNTKLIEAGKEINLIDSGVWVRGFYGGESYLRRNTDKIGEILINDPDPEVAELAFSSLRFEVKYDNYMGYKGRTVSNGEGGVGLSNKQKYVISKIKSRTRFNELKKFVLTNNEIYQSTNPEVAKFLAY